MAIFREGIGKLMPRIADVMEALNFNVFFLLILTDLYLYFFILNRTFIFYFFTFRKMSKHGAAKNMLLYILIILLYMGFYTVFI
jgi:hypothetical protein